MSIIPNSIKHKDRKYPMALFISLLISLQGLLMTLINIRDGSTKMVYVSASYAIIMFLVFLHTLFQKKLRIFYIFSTFVVIYLEISFLLTGGTEGFGIIWMTVIPPFAVYLYENKSFYFLNSLVALILIIVMWTPAGQIFYCYTDSFATRFPLVFLLQFTFSAFLKYRISKTEEELEKQRNTLTREIEQAANVQKTFLARPSKYYEHWTLGYKNIPLAGVSGDFYDIYSKENTLKGVSIFDISGHGISSGLLTMQARFISEYYFNRNYNSEFELWETVQKINDRFIEAKGEVPNYLTGIIFKICDNKIEFVNAGHQYPILYRSATNTFEVLKKDTKSKGAIGLQGVTSIYISQYFEMESNDRLMIFTDGLTDCENEKGETYGFDNLFNAFKKYVKTDVKEQVKLILQEVNTFRNKAEPNDDMTLLILKRD